MLSGDVHRNSGSSYFTEEVEEDLNFGYYDEYDGGQVNAHLKMNKLRLIESQNNA